MYWQSVSLFFFPALVLDLVLVGIVKAVVRRRRPAHNRMDMFATFSVDRYSFPSGHATRAAMCARFLLAHLVLAAPLRVLVMLWAVIVGLSRVLLGRHNVTDVAFGFFMGYCQYNLVEVLWLSPATLQNMMGQLEWSQKVVAETKGFQKYTSTWTVRHCDSNNSISSLIIFCELMLLCHCVNTAFTFMIMDPFSSIHLINVSN